MIGFFKFNFLSVFKLVLRHQFLRLAGALLQTLHAATLKDLLPFVFVASNSDKTPLFLEGRDRAGIY